MIDPDGIQLASKNKNTTITIDNVPEFDYLIWDLDNDKEFRKYIQTIEREIRQSYEYKEMIQYIKDNYDMNQCSFIKVSETDEVDVHIEIHHSPLTLYDIVNIVYRKRTSYGENLEVQMIAKEVTMLHYRLLIGLIPLSKTVHQLVHDAKIFIPVQNVLGNYSAFIRLYKPFMSEEELDTIERIERYSMETSDLLNTSVLDMNKITIQSNNKQYQLPDFNKISNSMTNRISEIKQNNFMLPVKDTKDAEVRDNKVVEIIKPFYFVDKEKEKLYGYA